MKRSCSSALVAILTACFDSISLAWSLCNSNKPPEKNQRTGNRGKGDAGAIGLRRGTSSTHPPADVRGPVGELRRRRPLVFHHLRRRHPREPWRTRDQFLLRRRKPPLPPTPPFLSFLLSISLSFCFVYLFIIVNLFSPALVPPLLYPPFSYSSSDVDCALL